MNWGAARELAEHDLRVLPARQRVRIYMGGTSATERWLDERALSRMRETHEAEIQRLRKVLGRAAYVAEHLFAMIDQETWRASGADDGQGHYEGDYRAEGIAEEIKSWAALAKEA